MTPQIRLKRIYEQPNSTDGLRVFVDRLWARGVRRQTAQIDLWPKELTPSTELRKWFHAGESRHDEFARRYRAEIDELGDALDVVLDTLRRHPVITLVTATKDLERGHSAVLATVLRERL